MIVIDHAALLDIAERIFTAAGSDPDEARTIADYLVEANLRGHDSHGVGLIPNYLQHLANGTVFANRHKLARERIEAMKVIWTGEEHEYRGEFSNFRWEREVDVISDFPDMRRVRVTIFYGHGFSRRFNLLEYMHNPNPPPLPNQPDANNPAVSGDQADPNE